MNNNRGSNNNNNNNRRRGRGNRQQGGGGGQQLNRIDSRARGNAPQLLEKYRKLAHDAHLNGDRVQAEYYLQFADHYFRVIADTRVRQEETRRPRDERYEGSEGGRDESDDSGEFSVESDFPTFDQPPQFNRQREDRPREDRQRDDRPRDDRPREDRPRDDRPREDRPRGDRQRDDRPRQPRREQEDRFEAPVQTDQADGGEADAIQSEDGERTIYEPAENPFVRGERPTRGLRPRRARRDEGEADGDAPAGLDPAMLPPSIGAAREEPAAEAPAKPRRGRPRKTPEGDAGETLESVS